MQTAEYRGQQFTFVASVRIGQGGMGEVYLGHRKDDPSAAVAIKVPGPRVDPDLAGLFLGEAAAAERVSHPNVVKVVD